MSHFHGVAVHNCWSPYWKYEGIRHAVCNAHLLRELTGVVENHPKQLWAKCFIRLLMDMKASKERRQRKGYDNLSAYASRKFDKTYDLIIHMGDNLNPLPQSLDGPKKGRPKRGKILSHIDRLSKYKESVCLFAKDFSVPFDNNQAERALRMVKVKTKVSGCFRSKNGAGDYTKIMSFIGTAKKLGQNAFPLYCLHSQAILFCS